ncbi:acyltransferase family protein [Demequina sp. SO4-18]|uniref:acyltransferase family protein n=1 Tax=Demequina sp. SO4-18 TaxID=3401026 RepID=UPI003B5C4846
MPRSDSAAAKPQAPPLAGPERAPADRFCPDLQALRALAVGLVVLYHLWPDRLTGGYVGVDVFFVISGFLITAHLWREAAVTGRIRLAHFWARRARRLLPPALLVLAVTAAGTIWLVPRSALEGNLREVLASTFYVENWYLSAQSVDYLGAGQAASAVQHYWTLSVEEQFYVILPLLMIAALAVAARLRVSRRRVVVAGVGAAVAASFVYGLFLSAASPAAYFSTFTRLWEFGLGALVALVLPRVRGHAWMAFLGVAMIVAAAVTFDASTPFPGYHALLPVVGTALVIVAGAGTAVARVGEWPPVSHLGRTSYSIYLWHWPLIVLVPLATASPLDAWTKVAIGAATIALASVSTVWVEEPVRFSPKLLAGRAPRVVAAWSIAGMAAVAAIAGVGLALADADADRDRKAAAEAGAALAREEVDCAGAAALAAPDRCDEDGLDAFVPALADLEEDDANRPECWTGLTGSEFSQCAIGSPTPGGLRILVLGDSHSNALISTYERLAESVGWQFDLAGRAGCYLTTRGLGRVGTDFRDGCESWREQALAAAAGASDYDAVLVTRRQPPDLPEGLREAEIEGMAEAWRAVAPGVPVLALVDNPRIGPDFVACLERVGPAGADECAVPRDTAVYSDLARDAAERVAHATALDLTDHYCTESECAAVAGGIVVYRPDGHHVGATYARTLAPALHDQITAALSAEEQPES